MNFTHFTNFTVLSCNQHTEYQLQKYKPIILSRHLLTYTMTMAGIPACLVKVFIGI